MRKNTPSTEMHARVFIDWKTEAPIASNEDSKGVRRHFNLESESSILGRAGSMAGRRGSMTKPERACPTKAGLG